MTNSNKSQKGKKNYGKKIYYKKFKKEIVFDRTKGRRVCKYYPTTLKEATDKIYFVRPMRNSNGDYSSGSVNFPKCMIGKNVKLEIIEKKECIMCNNEGLEFQEIAKLKIKAFGVTPMRKIVGIWYAMGYKPTDVICEECVLK